MVDQFDGDSATRRDLMRQAACVAGSFAVGSLTAGVAVAQGSDAALTKRYTRSLLLDDGGRPLKARQLQGAEPWLFNYPYVTTPVFLLALSRAPEEANLVTEGQQRYAAPQGVGPSQSVVAFSAICAHKLVYPTPQLSFIGVRRGVGTEPEHVIHCCADASRYDATRGARVLAGPAPQPLASVLLEWDAKTDQLHAVGVRGVDQFAAFFDKYSFKLEMEVGRRVRDEVGATCVVKPAASYSRQWKACSV